MDSCQGMNTEQLIKYKAEKMYEDIEKKVC